MKSARRAGVEEKERRRGLERMRAVEGGGFIWVLWVAFPLGCLGVGSSMALSSHFFKPHAFERADCEEAR